MKVRILPTAFADLDDVDIYVTDNFGRTRASEVQATLFTTFDLLADFPNMGRARPDVTHRPVRFFLLKPCWIIYEPGSPLIIHRVFHAARDLQSLKQK